MQVANRIVEDAFVDWNVNCANKPDLYVQFDEQVDTDDFLPLTGEPNDSGIYVQEVDGALLGFQLGDSFENRRTYTVKHEDGTEVTGTWSYDHTLHCRTDAETMTCRVVNRGRTPVLLMDTAKEIVADFLNGDNGTENTSYWDQKRDRHDWNQAVADREQVVPYINCFVVLQEDTYPHPQMLEDADHELIV